jgi:hypothetical protein
MTPIPQEKASALLDALKQHFSQLSHYDSTDSLHVRRWLRECDHLTQTDAPGAYELIGFIKAMCGDVEGARAAIENAKRLGYQNPHTRLAAVYLNNGYASRGLECVRMAIDCREPAPFQDILRLGVGSGAFHAVCQAVEAANANGTVLKIDLNMLNLVRQAANVIQTLGYEPDIVTRMADHAGEIMREKRLLWMNDTPTLRATVDADGDATLLYSYRVGVTPQEASDMNWQLAQRLADADLIRPGIAVEFVGERLGGPQ